MSTRSRPPTLHLVAATRSDSSATSTLLFRCTGRDLDFASDGLAWLVSTGRKVIYSGTGTESGRGSFGYRLTVQRPAPADAAMNLHIRIWDRDADDAVIYDGPLAVEEPAVAAELASIPTI